MITFRSRIIHHRCCRPTDLAPSCGVPAALLDRAPSGKRTHDEEAVLWVHPRPRTPFLHGSPSLRGERSAVASLTQLTRLKSDPIATMQRTYRCAAQVVVRWSTRNQRHLPSEQPTPRPVSRACMLRQEADVASRRHHLGGLRPSCRGCPDGQGSALTSGGCQ